MATNAGTPSPSAIRVLYLEDDPFDADLVRRRLEHAGRSCELTVANSRAAFRSALQKGKWDIVLCDYNIIGYSGRDALQLVRDISPFTPVIMVSGGLSEDEAVDCLHLGATDYLLKQSLVRLPAAVDRALQIARDQVLRFEAEEKFRGLLELSPDATIIVDSQGNMSLVNSQAEALFGYDRSEMLGQSIEMLVPERYRGIHAAQVSEFTTNHRARKASIPTELSGVRKDGREIPLEILLSPLALGEQTLTIAAIRDLTERRRLEGQLSRARRLESIGAFAGNIAHDLNNALAPVLMSLELMRTLNPDMEELIATVDVGVRRGAEMLRQLLVFSKGSYVQPKLVDTESLLSEVKRTLTRLLPKAISLDVSWPPDVWSLWGDRTQLYEVLINLCTNARDAMPEGGALTVVAENLKVEAIPVVAIRQLEVGDYVHIRVADTGHGMPPEVLDRVFEPFFTTKASDQGTGLGLSIVSGIVKSHDGIVTAYSTPGRGSVFSLYLPARREVTTESEEWPQVQKIEGRGRVILFVDDSDEIRSVGGRLLRLSGFRPVLASNGEEALQVALELGDELHAVITDLHMPRMTGLEFSRLLRAQNPGVGVVIISGMLEEDSVSDLRAVGVRAFLEKPFTEQMLNAALRSCLGE